MQRAYGVRCSFLQACTAPSGPWVPVPYHPPSPAHLISRTLRAPAAPLCTAPYRICTQTCYLLPPGLPCPLPWVPRTRAEWLLRRSAQQPTAFVMPAFETAGMQRDWDKANNVTDAVLKCE